jgi:exportin-1
MKQAVQDMDVLADSHNIKVLINVLRSNRAACLALGQAFLPQIGRIYSDMLGLYRSVSSIVNEMITSGQHRSLAAVVRTNIFPDSSRSFQQDLRELKTVRKEILVFVSTFFSEADDLDVISHTLLPPLLDNILEDYRTNAPMAREAEVLQVLAIVCVNLQVYPTSFFAVYNSVPNDYVEVEGSISDTTGL